MNNLAKLAYRFRWYLLIALVSIPTFITLVRPGYFPMHDDMQAMRVLQLDKCVQDGQIPCRWVPDMGYGYGYPQFIYYSPLPYYSMEAFHLLGFSILDSVKIVMSLGFTLAGLTMFIFARSLFGNWGGFLSSILYLYAPYRASDLYSRGAVGEFIGMIFLPLIFWSIYRFAKSKKTKYLLPLAISYAGLLTTHNITTLAFTPMAAIWGLGLLFYYKRFRLLPKLIIAGLLGIALASFFILPVVFEKPFAHIETMTVGYFNYLAHFVSLKQLFFSSFWGFGSSELGPYDDLTFAVGTLHWLFALLAAVLALFHLKSKRLLASITLLLVSFFVLASFMTHQRSSFIWSAIPLLKYFQFPWRFLSLATFASSAVAGAIIAFTHQRSTKIILTISLSLLVILLNFNFFRPNSWIDITDNEKFSGASWDQQMTISIFDYLPIFAETPPAAPAPTEPTILEGEATVQNFTKGSNWQQGTIEAKESASIQLPLYYFPGFKVTIDEQPVDITYDNHLGLITFDIPEGQHTFYARLHNTLPRTIGDILSITSLGVIIFWFIYEKKRI